MVSIDWVINPPHQPCAIRKHTCIIGDGYNTKFLITHNIGTTEVVVQVHDIQNGHIISPDIIIQGPNTVLIEFCNAPRTYSYRVVVVG